MMSSLIATGWYAQVASVIRPIGCNSDCIDMNKINMIASSAQEVAFSQGASAAQHGSESGDCRFPHRAVKSSHDDYITFEPSRQSSAPKVPFVGPTGCNRLPDGMQLSAPEVALLLASPFYPLRI